MEDNIKKRLEEIKRQNLLNKDKAEMLGVSNQGALDKDKLTVKGDPLSADATPKKMKETPIREYVANKKMIEADRAKREIAKRSDDILKTADTAIGSGNKELLSSLAKAAKEADDKDTLKKLIKKLADSKMTKTFGKKALSTIPLVGGIASAIMQQDASAMIPDEIIPQSVNQPKDELFRKLEQGTISDEERLELIRRSRDGR